MNIEFYLSPGGKIVDVYIDDDFEREYIGFIGTHGLTGDNGWSPDAAVAMKIGWCCDWPTLGAAKADLVRRLERHTRHVGVSL